MSLATFSQTGTNKKVHCFPDSIAKQIAIDLVRGDSAKVELAKTNILVNQLEEKTKSNDRLVSMYVNKVSNYASQIDLYRKKSSCKLQSLNLLSGHDVEFKTLFGKLTPN